MTKVKKYKYKLLVVALVFMARVSYAQQPSQASLPASVIVARKDSLENLNKPTQLAASQKQSLGADTTGQVSNQPPKMRYRKPSNWPPVGDSEALPLPPITLPKKQDDSK